MQVQTIFQAGNSNVVAIPKHLSTEFGFKPGQKVIVDKSSDGTGILVKKAIKTKSSAQAKQSEAGFQRWLKIFMKDNGEILDELAQR